ncbi:hypothetical protein [Roseospira navarrensis]|uniref:Uncharacterized protein n=1 Tax=Roseospira navarrensis TaxID=140058 RepID=A0A7X1ZBE9_9PROT|nr:hypothetical protein [Roseospira navarrensis]MQX35441.1 hypothetical protein [Roseospira navarrensis]
MSQIPPLSGSPHPVRPAQARAEGVGRHEPRPSGSDVPSAPTDRHGPAVLLPEPQTADDPTTDPRAPPAPVLTDEEMATLTEALEAARAEADRIAEAWAENAGKLGETILDIIESSMTALTQVLPLALHSVEGMNGLAGRAEGLMRQTGAAVASARRAIAQIEGGDDPMEVTRRLTSLRARVDRIAAHAERAAASATAVTSTTAVSPGDRAEAETTRTALETHIREMRAALEG